MRIVVTGGSGKGGAWVVRDLREHGHDVLNVDIRRDPAHAGPGLVADLTDLGQTLDALAGAEAVVHFAAIPRARAAARGRDLPDQRPVDLQRLRGGGRAPAAAGRLGVERDGARPAVRHPARLRADRRDDRAAPGVVLRALEARRRDDGRRSSPGGAGSASSACASRTSWSPTTTRRSRRTGTTRTIRKWNLWGYVDARDVAQAVRLGLEAPIEGSEIAIVAAADTVMTRPSADLMAEVFPTVPLRRPVEGRETLLAIDHARRLLGYEPRHRWADHVAAPSDGWTPSVFDDRPAAIDILAVVCIARRS